LQRGGERIVCLLRGLERLAVHQQSLRIGALHIGGGEHQRLDGVGDIVRLVEHVGGREISIAAFGIHQFVEDEEQAERIDGAGVEIVVGSTAGSAVAIVDANQIELALLNLVVNARDAMPDGGTISIDVSDVTIDGSDPDLAPGRYLGLAVTDTGKGMDAETLRRAVEPFFSTKGVGKGTGLGLSMIHGLALQLGGAFRLVSAPDRGTTATMLLPAAQTDGVEPVEIEQSTASGAAPAGRSSILVVDDDVLIAMSTVAMVEDLGHSVIEANSGPDALEIIRGGATIDLMITDISMPKMSGAELILAAR